MGATVDAALVSPGEGAPSEPSFYVINLYTWLTDRQAAMGLGLRVAEALKSFSDVDALGTTVSEEEDPTAEPVKVFADFVKHRADDEGEAIAEAIRHLEESGD